MIVLEVGINHFGKIAEAKKYLNYFLNSEFKHLTFMLHTNKFYKQQKNRFNFILPRKFYEEAIKKCHKKNKKIGLAVCDTETFEPLINLKFDFYKLLGIAINNNDLINKLKLKKKNVYVSLAKGNDSSITKCLKYFGKNNKLHLIYTNMSYDPKDLDLKRITYLKNKFKLPVGYGHHYNSNLAIYLATLFNPSFYFVYIKDFTNKKRMFPDNDHAFFTNRLNKLKKNLKDAKIIFKTKKVNTKIKINEKIKF